MCVLVAAGSNTPNVKAEQWGYRGCTGCTFPLLHQTSLVGSYVYTCQPCNAMGSGCNMCDCAGHCQSCAFGFTKYYDGCIDGIPLSTFQKPQSPSAAPAPSVNPTQGHGRPSANPMQGLGHTADPMQGHGPSANPMQGQGPSANPMQGQGRYDPSADSTQAPSAWVLPQPADVPDDVSSSIGANLDDLALKIGLDP